MLSYTEELVGDMGGVGGDLASGKYEIGSRQRTTTYVVAARIVASTGDALRVRAYIVAHR